MRKRNLCGHCKHPDWARDEDGRCTWQYEDVDGAMTLCTCEEFVQRDTTAKSKLFRSSQRAERHVAALRGAQVRGGPGNMDVRGETEATEVKEVPALPAIIASGWRQAQEKAGNRDPVLALVERGTKKTAFVVVVE